MPNKYDNTDITNGIKSTGISLTNQLKPRQGVFASVYVGLCACAYEACAHAYHQIDDWRWGDV